MSESKLAVTVDVEDWYHVPSVTGSPYSVYSDVDGFFTRWKGRYDYLSKPTMDVLDILDRYRITASFFVVADVVARYPGLVELIADRGHEIACHGLSHACKIHPRTKKPLLSVKEFADRTRRAKEILEKVSGEKVIGYRAPNGYIGQWMFRPLHGLGMMYDSSVSANSLYNKTDMNLAGISSYPYCPIEDNDHFVEFPWPYYDTLGLRIPTSGGPMLRFLGADIVWCGLKQSLKRGNTVFYIHPIDISKEDFPRVNTRQKAFWMCKGKTTEARFKYILNKLKTENVQLACLRDLVES